MHQTHDECKVRAPEKCLFCGAKYKGGSVLPGSLMKMGLRVFYECGASLSVAKDLGDECYFLRFKNCGVEWQKKN